MWLYIPTTSASTREGVDSISDSDSRIQQLARSYTWNESFKQPRSWLTILKRDSWSLRLFGLIPEPSTANRSLTEWIGSLEDSPASRGVSLEHEPEPTMNDGSGLTSRDWFARYDHAESLWKTSQASFMEELNTFSVAWPRSGSMRNGFLFERPTLVRPIAGSEYSSWPTPEASNFEKPKTKASPQTSLGHESVNWASPVAADAAQGDIENDNTKYVTTGTGRLRKISNSGESGSLGLAREVKHWATPTTRDYKDGDGTADVDTNALLGRQAPRTPMPGQTSQNDTGRRLNPRFVEWLMGLPDQHMDFHALLD